MLYLGLFYTVLPLQASLVCARSCEFSKTRARLARAEVHFCSPRSRMAHLKLNIYFHHNSILNRASSAFIMTAQVSTNTCSWRLFACLTVLCTLSITNNLFYLTSKEHRLSILNPVVDERPPNGMILADKIDAPFTGSYWRKDIKNGLVGYFLFDRNEYTTTRHSKRSFTTVKTSCSS